MHDEPHQEPATDAYDLESQRISLVYHTVKKDLERNPNPKITLGFFEVDAGRIAIHHRARVNSIVQTVLYVDAMEPPVRRTWKNVPLPMNILVYRKNDGAPDDEAVCEARRVELPTILKAVRRFVAFEKNMPADVAKIMTCIGLKSFRVRDADDPELCLRRAPLIEAMRERRGLDYE